MCIRDRVVEAEGVHHLMTFAELTGAATYIVHLSCKEALDQAVAARQRGVRVAIETLIQYLTLDRHMLRSPTSRARNSSCRRRCATPATRVCFGTGCVMVSSR